MKTTLTLTSFYSTDGLLLPGLLYRPGRSKKVLLYLHGCGSSSVFYRGEFMNLVASTLADRDISFFPFNNRGALSLHRLTRKLKGGSTEKVPAGTAYELIRECVYDIDGAVKHLRSLGFKEFYIAGHSTGANKIVLYNKLKRGITPFKKYILSGGGDDAGIYRHKLGAKIQKYLLKASQQIKRGKGLDLVPRSWLPSPYSYRSFVDIATPGGDYDIFPFNAAFRRSHPRHFKAFAEIKKSTLVLYGSEDNVNVLPMIDCIELLLAKARHKNNFTFDIIPGGDHSYSGVENKMLVSWITFLSQ